MRPGTRGWLRNHRVGAACQQYFHRAFVIGRIEIAQALWICADQLCDFAHHMDLIGTCEVSAAIMRENYIDRLVLMAYGIFPTPDRCRHKPSETVCSMRIVNGRLERVKTILQGSDVIVL